MSNKKHIDRLFQEKFKDFEVKPDSKIWKNIQNEIAPQKEAKKRIIPIWFKYGGVAALLLLFLAVGITTYNSGLNNNTIVDVETPFNETEKNGKINTDENSNSNSSVVSSNSGSEEIPKESENPVLNGKDVKTTINEQTSVTSSSNNLVKTEEGINKSKLVNTSRTSKRNRTFANKTISLKKSNTIIASTNKLKNNKPLSEIKNRNARSNNPENTGVAVISNSNVQKTTNNEEAINNAINAVKEDTFSSNTVAKSSNNTEASKIVSDSIAPINALENAVLANANNKTEKDKKESEELDRWSLGANVSPVYYNTIGGNGSHIDEEFVDNEKTGAINTSYGINVGYAINDRLKVRSGINSLNLGYDTNNVVVYESVASSGASPSSIIENLKTEGLNANGINITVISGDKVNTTQLESFFSEDNFKTTSLKQRINYIEVPVELEYALVNKRLGVNVVGGMSTFFLGENEVTAELKGTTTQIGEVNNINNISFSTNIGLGIDYGFSKAFKINLEPTFKYQINAFNDTSGNFNPFILGVYTGLSYKF